VALLLLLSRRIRLRGGRMFWLYAAYYTLGRVWIETLRIDDAEMVTLFGVTQRLNVWTSIAVFLLSLAVLIYLSVRRGPVDEPSVYLPGREPTPVDAGNGTDGGAVRTAGSEAAEANTAGDASADPKPTPGTGSADLAREASEDASRNASATGSHASDTGQSGPNRRGNLSETDGS